jgi:hypothetical protein
MAAKAPSAVIPSSAPDRIESLPNPFHLVVVDEPDHRIATLVTHGPSGHLRETF